MKLNAVGITSQDMKETLKFYTLLGFTFAENAENEGHVEPVTREGSARLMIDSVEIARSVYGHDPKPGNTAAFALEFESAKEIDSIVKQVQESNFTVIKAPWKAPWGQYYAVIQDPDGYIVDLYCNL